MPVEIIPFDIDFLALPPTPLGAACGKYAGKDLVTITAAEGNQDYNTIWQGLCVPCIEAGTNTTLCATCPAQKALQSIEDSLNYAYGEDDE